MSEQRHFLALAIEDGELTTRFVCTGKRGDACHKQAPDDRESWKPDDPDLIDTDTCWIADWIEATDLSPDHGGPRWEDDGEIMRLPITHDYYDRGLSPVCEVQTQAAHDAEVAAKTLEDAALSIDPTDAAFNTPAGLYLDGLMQGAKDAQVFLRALANMKRGA